eukprot:GHVU01093025.1.p1 GENE.GHVU01093025.1~~GHVU01093025.1.p1  ORF type:complete len:462 (+),score=61.15 GHVU01093025.1:54-1388(+)
MTNGLSKASFYHVLNQYHTPEALNTMDLTHGPERSRCHPAAQSVPTCFYANRLTASSGFAIDLSWASGWLSAYDRLDHMTGITGEVREMWMWHTDLGQHFDETRLLNAWNLDETSTCLSTNHQSGMCGKASVINENWEFDAFGIYTYGRLAFIYVLKGSSTGDATCDALDQVEAFNQRCGSASNDVQKQMSFTLMQAASQYMYDNNPAVFLLPANERISSLAFYRAASLTINKHCVATACGKDSSFQPVLAIDTCGAPAQDTATCPSAAGGAAPTVDALAHAHTNSLGATAAALGMPGVECKNAVIGKPLHADGTADNIADADEVSSLFAALSEAEKSDLKNAAYGQGAIGAWVYNNVGVVMICSATDASWGECPSVTEDQLVTTTSTTTTTTTTEEGTTDGLVGSDKTQPGNGPTEASGAVMQRSARVTVAAIGVLALALVLE